MAVPRLEQFRVEVLSQFGLAVANLQWQPVESAGFSGATVWRGIDREGVPWFALKAYPPVTISAVRLNAIHLWQQEAGEERHGLPFIPPLLRTATGGTFLTHADRRWEITKWMPGRADYHEQPSPERLAAACRSLARLHRVWRPSKPIVGLVPGITRRLRTFKDHMHLAADLDHLPETHPQLNEAFKRGREQLRRLIPAAESSLSAWVSRTLHLQPCHCDLWHDHVLFTHSQVTGLIDFGSTKVDHVSVDLARLLGSLVPDDDSAFRTGLTAYRSESNDDEATFDLVLLLARTGVLAAVANWLLRRLVHRHAFTNRDAIAARLLDLVSQLERRPTFQPF